MSIRDIPKGVVSRRAWLIPEDRLELMARLFMVPTLVFLVVFSGIPIVYTFYLSLTNADIFTTNPEIVGFSNYPEVLTSPVFLQAVWKDVIFAGGSIIVQVLVGLAFALILNNRFRGVSLARTLVIFPYLVPTIAVALMWKWMLSPVFGIFNSYAVELGLIQESIEFFGTTTWAMPMLILANSWKFTSFATIIFLARLQSIDRRMYEQAKICGSSVFQMFRDITLPNLRSSILLVVLLRTMFQFNKFDIVWLLTKGGPFEATETVPVYIYKVAFFDYNLALGAVASMLLFALLLITAIVYFRRFKPSEEIST